MLPKRNFRTIFLTALGKTVSFGKITKTATPHIEVIHVPDRIPVPNTEPTGAETKTVFVDLRLEAFIQKLIQKTLNKQEVKQLKNLLDPIVKNKELLERVYKQQPEAKDIEVVKEELFETIYLNGFCVIWPGIHQWVRLQNGEEFRIISEQEAAKLPKLTGDWVNFVGFFVEAE